MATVIIGFDASSDSRDALHLGSSIAHGMDAKLVVAAASNPPLDLEVSEAKQFAVIFDRAQGELPHREFAMRELRGVGAAAGLKDLAAREQADLIVVGSTHRGALGRVIPGAVGERLLSGAPCPVAVAPRGYADAEHFGLGLVGAAFDGSIESEAALAFAAALARRLEATLRVITITHDPKSATEPALDELAPWVEVESAVEDGDPARVLARHGVDLDLLVVGSRGFGPLRRTLLGGVSADVIRGAPCPVIAVPRTAAAMRHDPTSESVVTMD